jgi:hypothetical protein
MATFVAVAPRGGSKAVHNNAASKNSSQLNAQQQQQQQAVADKQRYKRQQQQAAAAVKQAIKASSRAQSPSNMTRAHSPPPQPPLRKQKYPNKTIQSARSEVDENRQYMKSLSESSHTHVRILIITSCAAHLANNNSHKTHTHTHTHTRTQHSTTPNVSSFADNLFCAERAGTIRGQEARVRNAGARAE